MSTLTVSTLAVVPFWDYLRFVYPQYLRSPDHYLQISKIFPILYANSFPDRSKSLDMCCTVSLGWSSQKIQAPVQITGLAPEGKQGGRCEYYLLKWESDPYNLPIDFVECQ